ncbi:MaoC/PaaZ C-terminal domain-containing protein [Metabacillus malikii]|uniref:Acyl dehydratase n=1 Tax=Metabacillus malikii TaxID=1504265 RepID=A0ABT9ZFF8_9BACI|nr:MaoC/PaaZ C-terminal domain-containing protein [Metabacillus malikii]MDQ0231013.1 acyl dehydratase [Metabacillus malikii]
MLLGKKRKPGKSVDEISVGEKITLTEKIEDKDLLLYLGLTNDANPLYIQHEYASQTQYKKPIVPNIMLTGIITSAISKYLPGPGSHIVKQNLSFIKPIYHYSIIQFTIEVTKIMIRENKLTIHVNAVNEDSEVTIEGDLTIIPPVKLSNEVGNS